LLSKAVVAVIFSAFLGPFAAQAVPQVHELEIAPTGSYTLDGVVVERLALADVLLRHKRAGEPLLVHMNFKKNAKYEDVSFAVEAIQKAGGQVASPDGKIAVVGGEAFYPSPKSSGTRR